MAKKFLMRIDQQQWHLLSLLARGYNMPISSFIKMTLNSRAKEHEADITKICNANSDELQQLIHLLPK